MTTLTLRTAASAAPAPVDAGPIPAPEGVHDRDRARRRRIRRADLMTAGAWTSAAAAVALFLSSGTMDLTTTAGTVQAAGIVAGLVGSDLVLVMLVLAARVPFIDRTIGHDAAMAAHRSIGKPAVYLLVAHALLLTVGYALTDRTNVITETLSLLHVEDMPWAYLSLALFLTVVVSSLVVARRRLPYEAWHAVHLLSYAAVLAGLPHQLSQGAVLAHGTWQRIYWVTLYVAALGSIVVFRVIRPLVGTLRHDIRVAGVERVGSDAFSVHLVGRDLDLLGARGGQFFFWRFLSPRTWWHAHPLSLSAEPTADRARITVRIAGDGTRRLAALRPGTRVAFSGPFGLFTDAARRHSRAVFLAAGVGVTPVRAMVERLSVAPGDVTVVVRGSTWDEMYLWPELVAWSRATGHRLYASVGPRARHGDTWLAASDVDRGVTAAAVFPRLAGSDVYICGPDTWADEAERSIRRLGVPRADIHRERFAS